MKTISVAPNTPGLRRPILWGLLACLLTGCAASPDPYVDESRASVFVVRGYFESGTLHRWQKLEGPTELLEVTNPAPVRLRSVATFVVEEPLVGAPAKKRLRLRFGYGSQWPELKLGQRYQYLAAIISDGSSNALEGVAPVARTTTSGWAVPVTLDRFQYLFPCSSDDVEREPLRFQEPRPRERLADRADAEDTAADLKHDESYTIENGYVYANEGVRLAHVAAAYEGKSAATVAGECE